MAKVDEIYHKLCEEILESGYWYTDESRGIRCLQLSSKTIEIPLDEFPLLTTKKMFLKGIVGELLWFLRGDTNIKYLVDNGVNIWNKDAYNYYLKLSNHNPLNYNDWLHYLQNDRNSYKNKTGIFGYKFGDLGRVYGAQWRNWRSYNQGFDEAQRKSGNLIKGLDQISNLIKNLREKPMSRRHIVTAWNPAELDEMALPPCHWSFEILVEPVKYIMGTDFIKYANSPKYQFTLKWHQRSVDTFFKLPFNIASYALLAKIIGKLTNMIPKSIIGDLSNVHIYKPHIEKVKEQLKRDVNFHSGTKLNFRKDCDFNNLEIKDILVENYSSYEKLSATMFALKNQLRLDI